MRVRRAIYAAAAAAILIAALIAFKPSLYEPAQRPGAQQYQEWAERAQKQPDIGGQGIPSPKANQNANERPSGDSDAEKSITDWIQAISATLIVGLTGAILVIYRRQTGVMAEQARVMGVQASTMINQTGILTESLAVSRNALTEAQKASLAAIRSVKAAEDTAERELRAYVTVSSGIIRDSRDPTKRKAVITIKNCGQTPAYDQTTWIGTHAREFPLLSALPPKPLGLPLGKNVLAPSQGSFIDAPIGPLNGTTEIKISEGSMAIYVFGQIDYRDIFGGNRLTKFRLFCCGDAVREGRLHPDVEGNDAT